MLFPLCKLLELVPVVEDPYDKVFVRIQSKPVHQESKKRNRDRPQRNAWYQVIGCTFARTTKLSVASNWFLVDSFDRELEVRRRGVVFLGDALLSIGEFQK